MKNLTIKVHMFSVLHKQEFFYSSIAVIALKSGASSLSSLLAISDDVPTGAIQAFPSVLHSINAIQWVKEIK